MLQVRLALNYPGFVLDVDAELPATGVTAIFGQSGSGKTSLLRGIAGLERGAAGVVRINGEIWQDEDVFLPTWRRSIGYVFQEASLFDHLSVRGNLDYGLKRAAGSSNLNQGRADPDSVVSLLGIDLLLDRKPNQLSGGERQRVAIARTLLTNPSLLLMDEPLASLDQARKREIIPYLKQLRAELDVPILYVSHAPDEVAQLADHILVMEAGRVCASGPLTEMLSRLDFPLQLGDDAGVVLDVEVIEKESQWNMEKVAFDGGKLWLRDSGEPLGTHHRVRILARDISLATDLHADTSIQNILPAVIDEIAEDTDQGVAMVRLQLGKDILVARVTLRSADRLQLRVGASIWAQIKSVALLT